MPTLDWIGKKAVLNHHREVPYHLLRCDEKLSVGDSDSGNLLVQGDNLLALKALLPYYAGQVKCIYIDPPYNTGNENWIYNDNVNSPEICKWLGKTVGKEAEDLSRHDKWLCMMYPRLQLLKEFLRDDGLLFVSIDDNETRHLSLLLDEIFGPRNFQQQLVWKNKYGPGAMTKGFGSIHEYIFCYSKRPVSRIQARLTTKEIAKYRKRDENYEKRGGYITQPLATRSKDDRPNLVYPIQYKGESIWPDKQWIWSQERMEAAIAKGEVEFRKSKGKWSVRFKQYLREENGVMRLGKPISILLGPFNQDGTKEIRELFGDLVFNNPKPKELIKYLVSMIIDGQDDRDYIVMDSFVGSGTTGHAVLDLNREDGGNRRFILVEMEETIAQEVTLTRLKKATQAMGEHASVDPSQQVGVRYCRLHGPIFDGEGNVHSGVKFNDLAAHVFFSETGVPIPRKRVTSAHLGIHNGTAVYLLFNGILGDKRVNGGNVLTGPVLKSLPAHDGPRVIYGEGCRIGAARLKRERIVFKQIPYQIKVS